MAAHEPIDRILTLVEEKTGLTAEQAKQALMQVLGGLVRRTHFTRAARMIALLPEDLQEELLDLPAGPDESIQLSTLIDGLITRFSLSESDAQTVLIRICRALEETIPAEELGRVKDQLPDDLRSLFSMPAQAA
jgi:uncharacterized protein (DUF2267 family)